MEVVASLSQGRTAAAQCGLFTYKSVPVIFEPPCIYDKLEQNGNCTDVLRRFEDGVWLKHSKAPCFWKSVYIANDCLHSDSV